MGNYEPCPYNPIMRQTDEKAAIQRCGHGKPVCTQNGDWYMVYLCGRRIAGKYSILGRETALDPITWTADGWPVVNGLRGPSALQIMPDLKRQERKAIAARTFQNGLPADFITPRPPEKDGITCQNGKLLLKGSRKPLSSVHARNILVRRQSAFCFQADAELCVPELSDGQEAGITCYYDENTWVCFFFSKDEDGYFLQVKEHIGEKEVCHGKERLVAPAGKQYILGVETRYLHRRFYFAAKEQMASSKQAASPKQDGNSAQKDAARLDNVYYLCDEGISMGKRFTGAMVGMYGYAGEKPLLIEYSSFNYQELSDRS